MPSTPPNPGFSAGSPIEKLTIQTPEQTALDFEVAGIGSRFIALAYDVLIQALIGIVIGIVGVFAIGRMVGVAPRASLWGGAVLVLTYFFLYFGYYPLFEILWNGQTPGKRKAGIRVIKDSGRPLTPAETIGRNLMRIVDWLPLFYGVGIVTAFFTKGSKRLGDLVVGSLVVRETSLRDLKPAWQIVPESATTTGSSLGPLGAERLSADECALIDSFLSRRSALESHVRYRMAEEVLRRLRPKLTLPPGNTVSPETILVALAYERRAIGSFSK